MIRSWRIGEAVLTGLAEYYGPVHVPSVLYPDMDHQVLRDNHALLEGRHWIEATDRLVIGVQIWIFHAGDRVILVDTGIGNNKPRRTPRANNLNTVAADWLAAAGATPDTVTDVVITHLHSDHIGWNTILKDGAWQPTFRNATYHIPRADYDWFAEFNGLGKAKDGGSFYDSVEPVVAAGQARFVNPGDSVAAHLMAVAAFGHTPGHLNYWFESRNRRLVFSGDVLHHPVQIFRPDWNSIVDIQPEIASATRAAFLQKVSATDALIAPCHFGVPHCGFIRENAGYSFIPAHSGHSVARAATSAWAADASPQTHLGWSDNRRQYTSNQLLNQGEHE